MDAVQAGKDYAVGWFTRAIVVTDPLASKSKWS